MNLNKYIVLGLLLIIVGAFSHLTFGSVYLSPNAFFSFDFNSPEWVILSNIRIPRIVVSLLLGASLSVAGLQIQTLFKNGLAGPGVLGISSGASMGVAIYILGGTTFWWGVNNSWALVGSAIAGALLVMQLILILTRRISSNIAILIVGIMIASAMSSIVGFLQYLSNAEDLQSYIVWTMGSTFVDSWEKILVFSIVTIIALIVLYILRNGLKLLLLSDKEIHALGVNLKKMRIKYIVLSCVLVGVATAFCGPISFVGLAVPHVVRFLTGETNPSKMFGLTMVYGMLVMLLCDWIASVPGSELTIPINIITSFIGAPLVVYLILKSKLRNV